MLLLLYFGLGGALVGGAILGSGRLPSETLEAFVILLGLLAFPSSYFVAYLIHMLESMIWPARSPWIASRLELMVILLAGYFQWFYIVPWVFVNFKVKIGRR